MKQTPRQYQIDARAEVRAQFAAGFKRALVQMPTGAGKTVFFSDIAADIGAKGGRVLIGAHRRELLRQASAKLLDAGAPHGLILPGQQMPRPRIHVGSIQTLIRRLDKLPRYNLIIPDEAHHTVAPGWRALFESQPQAALMGVTATPERLDGQGLGGIFDCLVLGPSVADLVAQNYLASTIVYAPSAPPDVRHLHMLAGDFQPAELATVMDRPSITGDAAEHYERICPGKPFIGFCVNVQAAHNAAAVFRAEGWRVAAVWGDMGDDARDKALADLESGALHGLMSCGLIDEGLDVPRVECIIDLAPTKSLGRWLQRVGRGLRLYPFKLHCILLDHAGNTFRHGMPDHPRQWSLEGIKRRADSVPPVRQCMQCYCIHAPAPCCPQCGFDYAAAEGAAKKRELERRAGELALMTAEDKRLDHLRSTPLRDLMTQARTFDELDEIRRARGFKVNWTQTQVAMRSRARNKR